MKQNQAFNDLMEEVLDQLKSQKYMKSTLNTYRYTYNRLHVFLNNSGTDIYTHESGCRFLKSMDVLESTLVVYKCVIRRLDDYIDQKPYRLYVNHSYRQIPEVFRNDILGYFSACKRAGNKLITIRRKENACTLFLEFLEKSCCLNLSELNTELVSNALLIYDNKDNYAIIRQFLKYLWDNHITNADYSKIVPNFKKPVTLPTVYTTEEIIKIESAVDTDSNIGKRNLAMIRLASRMGLRSGDIAKLKISEIDFDTGFISIVQEKTGAPIALQMPKDVELALKIHIATNEYMSHDGYVFHSMKAPYNRISTSIIRHAVNDSLNASGIDIAGRKHGPHALRSSLATSMINDGISYNILQQILGHTSPDVIKHYAKVDIESLRLCSIEPPAPTGDFLVALYGNQKEADHV